MIDETRGRCLRRSRGTFFRGLKKVNSDNEDWEDKDLWC